jgi:hypothetical protein
MKVNPAKIGVDGRAEAALEVREGPTTAAAAASVAAAAAAAAAADAGFAA